MNKTDAMFIDNYNGTLKERFRSFVNLEELENSEGCWNWTGNERGGYGQISKDKKTCRAHIVAYELFIGAVPDGLVVTHTCNNPSCVNPKHLVAKTQAENIQQAHREGRVNFKGQLNNASKLTEDEVRFIKRSDDPGIELAVRFGISPQNICDIRKGRSWRHVY